MALPIVVDIAPSPAVSPELASILLEACSRAAGGEGCVLGDPKRTRAAVGAVAVIWLEGAGNRRFRIDVAALGSPDGALLAREIEFREEDPPADRFRAAGLMVAAMAVERSQASAEAAPPSASAHDGAGKALPRSPSWSLAAGGLYGGGALGTAGRAGGWATVGVLDVRTGAFATFSASYAHAADSPSPGLAVQWLTLGAGAGLSAPIRPAHALVRARVEGFLEGTIATAHDMVGAPSQSGLAWGFGTRTVVDVVWPTESAVALVGGVDGFLRTHGTTVRVHGKPAATVPPGGYSAILGIQLTFR